MFKVEKLDLLISIYIACIAISELMGAKTFPVNLEILKLNASVAIFVLPLIIPYWLLKCLMSVIETPLVYIGVKWLKGSKK